MTHYSDYVDPYIGSISYLLKATQPLVHLPHAMAQIRPVLDESINDHYLAPVIYGFPANRGRIMPDAGDAPVFFSSYDHDFEEVKCYRGKVLLEDSGVTAEYTVTEHCAVYRFAYPAGKRAFLRVSPGGEGCLKLEDGRITGSELWEGVPFCFALNLSEEPLNTDRKDGALCLEFRPGACLVVKAGFSYIDTAQAAYNLEKETDGISFDEAADRARAAWDETLGRIEVEGGTEKEKRIFYTSLYRVHQRMIDITEYGKYFSGYDRRVHEDETHEEAFKDADVLIALSKPGPDTIKPEWIRLMADKAIVFACANPVPEIYPYKAKEAGAYIVATGRGDFPNQVNNSVCFPAILKGTLLVSASKITDAMAIRAAHSIADYAEKKGLSPDCIMPTMMDSDLFPHVAADVAMQAIQDGVARKTRTWQEVLEIAQKDIQETHEIVNLFQDKGYIRPFPEEMVKEIVRQVCAEV